VSTSRLTRAQKRSPDFQRAQKRYPHDADEILEMRARDAQLHVDPYAWPGGYPMYYLAAENGDPAKENCVSCPDCADKLDQYDEDLGVIAYDINYEDPDLFCEFCNERIESAYAEGGEEEEDDAENNDEVVALPDDSRSPTPLPPVRPGHEYCGNGFCHPWYQGLIPDAERCCS